MIHTKLKLLSAAFAVGLVAAPVQASFVAEPGYDLFRTFKAQLVNPFGMTPPVIQFEGHAEHIGTQVGGGGLCGDNAFDFGSGCVDTMETDTIVRRLDQADGGMAGGSDTIQIEVVGLSLISLMSADFGFGVEQVVGRVLKDITNDVWIHGQDLGSSMDITFDDMQGGTFDSTLLLSIDLYGHTSQEYLGTTLKTFMTEDAIWNRDAAGRIIPGVNYQLNGVDTSEDFFPFGAILHDDGNGSIHKVKVTPIPAALPLMASAIAGLGFVARRRRKVAA